MYKFMAYLASTTSLPNCCTTKRNNIYFNPELRMVLNIGTLFKLNVPLFIGFTIMCMAQGYRGRCSKYLENYTATVPSFS